MDKGVEASDIRPKHYGGEENPFEPIKIIEHYKLDFHLGNSVKYVLRAGKKDPDKEIEDLEKAIWYMSRKVQKLKDKKNTAIN